MEFLSNMFAWLIMIAATRGLVTSGQVVEEHVCEFVDIRRSLHEFKELAGCTVIEGYLRISWFDTATTEADFRNLSFPLLREVTDYVLLFRVSGLRSLTRLFPNLSVIRGQTLMYNEALIIYEMNDMLDVGLTSLIEVKHGGVRIRKNPQLCYLETVNWQKIIKAGMLTISSNRPNNECVDLCPQTMNGMQRCPHLNVTRPAGGGLTIRWQPLCWNADHCQLNTDCPRDCIKGVCNRGANNKPLCCHPQCAGGCSGPTSADCFVCKNVVYNGRCVSACPSGMFMYRERRCLTETECRSWQPQHARGHKLTMKVRTDMVCSDVCQESYEVSPTDVHKCEPCNGTCPKVCSDAIVNNVAVAEVLKKCTIIDGDLEIQISGNSVFESDLEESLGSITEITGVLHVRSSYALTSLRFLKNLRTIGGRSEHFKNYSLVVTGNPFLQEIWDLKSHPRLKLERGQVQFIDNAKLCTKKIVEFEKSLIVNSSVELDNLKNGYSIICEPVILTLSVEVPKIVEKPLLDPEHDVDTEYVIITWNNLNMTDNRLLISWNVNYRVALPNEDESSVVYNLRGACGAGSNNWKMEGVKYEDVFPMMSYYVRHLKAYTRYVIYVETYTVSAYKDSGISNVVFFTTNMAAPSKVHGLHAEPRERGQMHVSWFPPLRPKGVVHKYVIVWRVLKRESYEQRNYCIDKRTEGGKEKEKARPTMATGSAHVDGSTCCACTKPTDELHVDGERMDDIGFEDQLIETLSNRQNYDLIPINESLTMHYLNDSTTASTLPANQLLPTVVTGLDENVTLPSDQNMMSIYNATSVTLTDLPHYEEYIIEVVACNDPVNTNLWSSPTQTSARTLPDVEADSISWENMTAISDEKRPSMVRISWPEPTLPNGAILTYELELLRIDVSNHKMFEHCISHKHYSLYSGITIEHLAPGNWSYRVRAVSLAGVARWTPHQYFSIIDTDVKPERNELYSRSTVIGVSVIGAILGLAALSALIFGVRVYLRQRFMSESKLTASANPYYLNPEDVFDEWEVPREKVKILEEVGQGSFGSVYRGILHRDDETDLLVAIKTVNETAAVRDRMQFLQEASVMKAIDCYHMVKLFGVVSRGLPTLVLMEYMSNGDLKNYLRCRRVEESKGDPKLQPPTPFMMFRMAAEIADGMAFLEANKFVHRDLAARNCLVSENLVVKIGDFGMARDIYSTEYYRVNSKGLMPVRWMAPETLHDGVFTLSADVWSYGVVLWEIVTLGALPYPGLANEQVYRFVLEGRTLDIPEEGCPPKLAMLMQACWRRSRSDRPMFRDILEELLPDLSETFAPVSYYCSVLCAAAAEPSAGEPTADPESDSLLLHDEQRRGSTPSTARVAATPPPDCEPSGAGGGSDEKVSCIQPLTQPMATYCNGVKRSGTSGQISPIHPPPSVPSCSSLPGPIASSTSLTNRVNGGPSYQRLPPTLC